jgi:chromate transporter
MATSCTDMSLTTALRIILLFGTTSLLSIGGGNSVVPEIELQAVDTYHWVDGRQFADLFAIAQAAPGPSTLIVTLVGHAAGGIGGAILATVAMIVPAGALVYICARQWQRAPTAAWRVAFEHGLAPVAVGLIAASGLIVARSADHELSQYLLTGVATLIFCTTRVNPLAIIAAAACIGMVGLV